ncbi:MAG: hypothetical protein NT133_00915 [Alphaproteobacteria bacterium]|nr:hypothetical protein [Alphaproteobacteria bacterium]
MISQTTHRRSPPALGAVATAVTGYSNGQYVRIGPSNGLGVGIIERNKQLLFELNQQIVQGWKKIPPLAIVSRYRLGVDMATVVSIACDQPKCDRHGAYCGISVCILNNNIEDVGEVWRSLVGSFGEFLSDIQSRDHLNNFSDIKVPSSLGELAERLRGVQPVPDDSVFLRSGLSASHDRRPCLITQIDSSSNFDRALLCRWAQESSYFRPWQQVAFLVSPQDTFALRQHNRLRVMALMPQTSDFETRDGDGLYAQPPVPYEQLPDIEGNAPTQHLFDPRSLPLSSSSEEVEPQDQMPYEARQRKDKTGGGHTVQRHISILSDTKWVLFYGFMAILSISAVIFVFYRPWGETTFAAQQDLVSYEQQFKDMKRDIAALKSELDVLRQRPEAPALTSITTMSPATLKSLIVSTLSNPLLREQLKDKTLLAAAVDLKAQLTSICIGFFSLFPGDSVSIAPSDPKPPTCPAR